jgi:NADPH-dependent 2,4-dienoyl-CoA reductase/sulfur reductase-like enzyme
MEAARRLAERGHRPVLFEREKELGGSLVLAGSNPLKGDVRRYAEWSRPHVEKNGRARAAPRSRGGRGSLSSPRGPTPSSSAVGGEQIRPDVVGADGDNVCFAVDLDMGRVRPGARVLIVGAGLTGSETAAALAREGREVTVIDLLPLEELRERDKNIRRAHELAEAYGARFRGGLRLAEIRPGRRHSRGGGRTEDRVCLRHGGAFPGRTPEDGSRRRGSGTYAARYITRARLRRPPGQHRLGRAKRLLRRDEHMTIKA